MKAVRVITDYSVEMNTDMTRAEIAVTINGSNQGTHYVLFQGPTDSVPSDEVLRANAVEVIKHNQAIGGNPAIVDLKIPEGLDGRFIEVDL